MNLNLSFSGKEFKKQITVLIADDDYDSYWLITRALKHQKVNIIWAKNGAEAVNICKSDKSIDIVLMDIRMPVMNGFEATTRIKEIRQDLPVIIQTAYAKDYENDRFMSVQFDGFIKKPVRRKQLEELIKKHVFSETAVNSDQ